MTDKLSLVMEGIVELGSQVKLIGGHCFKCKKKFFPSPMVCPYCIGPIDQVHLSTKGKIYSLTIVRIKPPFGLPEPYGVAYIDLMSDGLRIFSLLDPKRTTSFSIDQAVVLRVGSIGHNRDGKTCLRYFFTPSEG